MNPFIEGQMWEDFHTDYIVALRARLVPQLAGRYIATVEKRVYIERHHGSQPEIIAPDVAIVRAGVKQDGVHVKAPFMVPIAMPEEMRERFITIRLKDSREVVTVIELLSPTNKQSGSDGREAYLAKRNAVLQSSSNLVEIDLLRGGQRVPMGESLPPGDFYVIVTRMLRRPMADVWPFVLREPLGTVAIPLAADDADVSLDLQAALDETTARACYDNMLDYSVPLRPALSAADQAWVEAVLKG